MRINVVLMMVCIVIKVLVQRLNMLFKRDNKVCKDNVRQLVLLYMVKLVQVVHGG